MNTNKARLALNIALDEVDNDIKALKRANKVLMDELEKERLRRYKVYSKKGFDAYKGEVYFIDGDLHVVVDVEKIAFNVNCVYFKTIIYGKITRLCFVNHKYTKSIPVFNRKG